LRERGSGIAAIACELREHPRRTVIARVVGEQ
jgi:hypothetical protein